jgi:outer membrane receptor for ferrienterochelin and colicins
VTAVSKTGARHRFWRFNLTPLLLCLALLPAFPAFGQEPAPTEPAPGGDLEDTDWEGANVFYAGEITVTGTRTEKRLADSPVATEIIDAAELENSSAATLSDALDDYGLVYSSNVMGDYIQLQGLGESRVLYLIDGRRVTGRVAGRLNGDTLPLDRVERIEIVRGPQSALYGSDGIGGVVNIITKKPKDSFSLSAGVSNSFIAAYNDPATGKTPGPFDKVDPFREQKVSAAVGIPIGPARNSLSLNFSRAGLYLDEGERSSILPRQFRGQGSLETAFSPTELADLRLGGSFMFLQSDQQTNVAGSLARSDYLRAEGFAQCEWFPLPEMILSFRLYDNYYRRDRSAYAASTEAWADTGQFENENTLALEAAGTWAGFNHWLLSGGLEGSYNSMDKFNLTERINGVDREAVFVQAERFAEGVYSVLGGFRLERNSQYGFSAAPKISAMYHLPKPGGGASGFRVLGSLGVGYRAPNFNDLYLLKDDPPHPLIRGNADLRPEYAANLSAGLEYAHKRGSATVNGYYTELFDEIAYSNTGLMERGMAVYDTGNISRSLRAGFDTEGKVSFLAWGYASAGYSYVFAWDRAAETELHPQPAHTVKFRLGLDTAKGGGAAKPWSLHLWAGGRFFSAVETIQSRGDTRLVLDMYAAVSMGEHVKVYASADNLLGTIDIFFGPAAPQTFSLGLNYTL